MRASNFKRMKMDVSASDAMTECCSVSSELHLPIRSERAFLIGGCPSLKTDIYDFATNTVSRGPSMVYLRRGHCSVSLPNKDILLFGGRTGCSEEKEYLTSCELFDAKRLSFSVVGHSDQIRVHAASVLLPGGLVLIIGGYDGKHSLNSCEFYDPQEKKFFASRAKLGGGRVGRTGRIGHTATLLADGTVLVCGGWNGSGEAVQTTEFYDPYSDSFSDGPLMTVKRSQHTATALLDGKILLTGGEKGYASSNTEIYDPDVGSFSPGAMMGVSRYCHFAMLVGGKVFIGGGSDALLKSTTFYDPDTKVFSDGAELLKGRSSCSISPF